MYDFGPNPDFFITRNHDVLVFAAKGVLCDEPHHGSFVAAAFVVKQVMSMF
jgi:hypothetical protein